MQFAWYLKRFGREPLVCTVLAASWSQHLYYAGDYLHHFVLFATYCLELVLESISGRLACIWGLFLVDVRFSVRLVWAGVCFLIVLRFRFGCSRFPLGFTSACAIVLIWGWLGVCLVSI